MGDYITIKEGHGNQREGNSCAVYLCEQYDAVSQGSVHGRDEGMDLVFLIHGAPERLVHGDSEPDRSFHRHRGTLVGNALSFPPFLQLFSLNQTIG